MGNDKKNDIHKLIYKSNAEDKLSWIVEFFKIIISIYLKQEHKRIAPISITPTTTFILVKGYVTLLTLTNRIQILQKMTIL